jgi:hypothetical protein
MDVIATILAGMNFQPILTLVVTLGLIVIGITFAGFALQKANSVASGRVDDEPEEDDEEEEGLRK